MRAITRYFWQVYYRLRPVGRQSTKTAYVRAACRVHGVKVIEHPVVRPEAADYRGLGWTGVTKSKICAETTCNHVFVPNSSGRCPKCGSESIWLSNTAIGKTREEQAEVVRNHDKKVVDYIIKTLEKVPEDDLHEKIRREGWPKTKYISEALTMRLYGVNKPEDRAGVRGLPRALTSRRAAEEWDKYFQKQEAKEAALRKAKGVLKWEE